MTKFQKALGKFIFAFQSQASLPTQTELAAQLEAIVDQKVAERVSELRRELIPELT